MTTNDHFFRFDKTIVTDGTWAKLPNNARAAFLTIASYLNIKRNCIPGRKRISKQAGYLWEKKKVNGKEVIIQNLKSVTVGVDILEKYRLLKRRHIHIKTKNEHVAYDMFMCKYCFPELTIENADFFKFYDNLVRGDLTKAEIRKNKKNRFIATSVWAELLDVAKNLYICMRADSYPYPFRDKKTESPNRQFEICTASKKKLKIDSGLSESSYFRALAQLKKCGLVVKLRSEYNNTTANAIYMRLGKIGDQKYMENELDEAGEYSIYG